MTQPLLTKRSTTSSAAEMANQSKPFRFLDLPPELRVRVYSYLFEFEGPLTIFERSRSIYARVWTEHGSYEPGITTGLLVACRQIHREATPVLYGCNTFDVNHNRRFLKTIKRYIPHIRRFIVGHSTKTARHADFVLLKAATSLSYLEIPSYLCEGKFYSLGHERQALAKEMGPLFRSLHQSQKKDIDRKDRDVLNVLVISTKWAVGFDEDHVAAKAKQYENEIKEAIRKTLK